MPDIVMSCNMDADAETVWRAITTTDGVTGWFTGHAEIGDGAGGHHLLTFPEMPAPWDLRVEDSRPARRLTLSVQTGPERGRSAGPRRCSPSRSTRKPASETRSSREQLPSPRGQPGTNGLRVASAISIHTALSLWSAVTLAGTCNRSSARCEPSGGIRPACHGCGRTPPAAP